MCPVIFSLILRSTHMKTVHAFTQQIAGKHATQAVSNYGSQVSRKELRLSWMTPRVKLLDNR